MAPSSAGFHFPSTFLFKTYKPIRKNISHRNPIAMLLTAKLMLDRLKETEMATRLETGIARMIAEGKVRTYDMGGKDSTLEVAKAIADYASS
jgi:isocitrate/isopropylmalate dehydrogenase